ncbi:MAG: SpoIIE family protein phosphatase [Bacteroidales bacterium]|nr:SpoIIE family protein phosphatase [Bacteroidales bacterium]
MDFWIKIKLLYLSFFFILLSVCARKGISAPQTIQSVQDDSIENSFAYNITSIEVLERNEYNPIFIYSDSIELTANFKYIKIDFSKPTEVTAKEYTYSVQRNDKKPLYYSAGKNNYIVLSRLKPGNYTVRIYLKEKIIDPFGILHIKVNDYKYAGKKAILLYILIFIVSVFILLRFQTRTLRKISRQFRERDRLAIQLMKQKEELTQKNKNITDSITYAKRIQNALMPPEKHFKILFPQSFILHISKDIVSGDFYWINETDDKILIAAVDCTGHGVPGAFMSIIGFELFRKITSTQGIKKPSEILNELNNSFKSVFKDVDDFSFKDGMDVAFCSIDKKNRILEFSGAFNPLYIIRDNTVTEIKGDRYSIGLDHFENPDNVFTNHTIQLEKDDVFYIFSDGFADQFGGPEGKKYKYRRFRHLLLALHHLPMEKQKEYLKKSILDWKGNLDQVDDILVIGIKANF